MIYSGALYTSELKNWNFAKIGVLSFEASKQLIFKNMSDGEDSKGRDFR